MTCKDCISYEVCENGQLFETPCIHHKNKADFVEVRHGEWILRRQSNGVKVHQCSVCGRPIYTIDEDLKDYAPYCHCGAKMDGERK